MIKLFSTDCPRCRVLEKKLDNANINYVKENNIQEVIDEGFMSAPVLKVDDQYYDFKQAVDWVGSATSANDCAECQF